MKYTKQCPHCHTIQTAYTFQLNESVVQAFARFAEKYMELGRGLKMPEIGLTNAQYTNFHKLGFFGLITRYAGAPEWHLTKLGRDFYYGTVGVLTPAAHMAGEVLGPTHEAWDTHEADRKTVFIGDIFPIHYKQRVS